MRGWEIPLSGCLTLPAELDRAPGQKKVTFSVNSSGDDIGTYELLRVLRWLPIDCSLLMRLEERVQPIASFSFEGALRKIVLSVRGRDL